MSCAAFTILSVIIAKGNKSNDWAVGASAALAVVFFVIASYRAWKRQYDARMKAESDLRQATEQPDIQGEAFLFKMTGSRFEGIAFSEPYIKVRISFHISVCNRHPVSTNVKTLAIDGGSMEPPWGFSEIAVYELLSNPDRTSSVMNPELPRGHNVNLLGEAWLTIGGPDVTIKKIEGAVVTRLRIYLVDGFGNRHPISVRTGQPLWPA